MKNKTSQHTSPNNPTLSTLHPTHNRYSRISKINNTQIYQHFTGRSPFRQSFELTQNQKSIDQKIKSSFHLKTGVVHNSSKHTKTKDKSRDVSFDNQSNNKFTKKIAKLKSQRKSLKGLSMQKMTSRDYHYNLNNKPCIDERLFNNFQLKRPKTAHTRSFQKQQPRNLDFTHHHTTHLDYNSQKVFEKYYYKNTPLSCRFNYKKQKQQNRVYFTPPQSFNNDVEVEKVKNAFLQSNNHQKIKDAYFFIGSGKQLPSSFEQMQMTPLKDHWRVDGKIPRAQLHYNIKKMREDMSEKRRLSITQRKKVNFQKGQLCDTKYFLVTGFGKQPLNID